MCPFASYRVITVLLNQLATALYKSGAAKFKKKPPHQIEYENEHIKLAPLHYILRAETYDFIL